MTPWFPAPQQPGLLQADYVTLNISNLQNNSDWGLITMLLYAMHSILQAAGSKQPKSKTKEEKSKKPKKDTKKQ